MSSSKLLWRVAPTLVASVALFGATTARAQGFGPDPFRPYNAQYDSFVYPVRPDSLSPSSNMGLNEPTGVRGANQYQRYLNGLSGAGGTPARYDQANRAYDRQFNRDYRPNREADAKLDRLQTDASDLYFRYLRETDPRKRAALLKQFNQTRNQTSRELAAGRTTKRDETKPRADAKAATDPTAGFKPTAPSVDVDPTGRVPRTLGTVRRPTSRSDLPPSGTTGDESATNSGDEKPSEILDRALEEKPRPRTRVPRANVPPPPPVIP